MVRRGAAGGPRLSADAQGQRPDADFVRAAGLCALQLGVLHAAHLPGPDFPGALPAVFCGDVRRAAAGGVLHPAAGGAVAVAGRRGAGPCGRLSGSGGRGAVPCALCGAGQRGHAGGAGAAEALAVHGGAGHPVRSAGGGGGGVLRDERPVLRRVHPVGFLRRRLRGRHGRHVPRCHRQHRPAAVGARRCAAEIVRCGAGIAAAAILAGGGSPAAERLPGPGAGGLPGRQLLLGHPPRRPV